jgi:hypothetical protein
VFVCEIPPSSSGEVQIFFDNSSDNREYHTLGP